MTSRVHFIPATSAEPAESLAAKAERLFLELEVEERVEEKSFVALKTHFGEKGNTGHIKPAWLSRIVRRLSRRTPRVFLTDTNTLYTGHRSNAVEHVPLTHDAPPHLREDVLPGRDRRSSSSTSPGCGDEGRGTGDEVALMGTRIPEKEARN